MGGSRNFGGSHIRVPWGGPIGGPMLKSQKLGGSNVPIPKVGGSGPPQPVRWLRLCVQQHEALVSGAARCCDKFVRTLMYTLCRG